MVHRGHQVEILDVDGHELCIGSQDDTVEHKFDGEKVCCWGATITGVVE